MPFTRSGVGIHCPELRFGLNNRGVNIYLQLIQAVRRSDFKDKVFSDRQHGGLIGDGNYLLLNRAVKRLSADHNFSNARNVADVRDIVQVDF